MPRRPSANVRIGQGKQRLCLIPICGAGCTEWTFRNCWREPINGDSSEGADFQGGLDVRIRNSCGGSLASYGTTILVRQNYERHNRRTLLQGAQTGQNSHPPKQGRNSSLTLVLRFTAPGSDARTLLAACFSTLLEEIADQLHRLFRRGSGMDKMGRKIFEQAHPGLVGPQQNDGLLCLERQCHF